MQAFFFYLAGGIPLNLRSTDGESVDLFLCPLEFKFKIRTVGVARQQRHFLCSDKENEAKESFALRWACLARNGGGINLHCSKRSRAYASPAEAEAL